MSIDDGTPIMTLFDKSTTPHREGNPIASPRGQLPSIYVASLAWAAWVKHSSATFWPTGWR
jgi:hypothetical protein